jgi:Trypsin-like peptidase domain
MQSDEPEKPLDDSPEAVAARHRKTWLVLGGVIVVVALLLAFYNWLQKPPPLPGTGETLSPRQIANAMQPWVGRLQSIGVSGEARFVGLAVAVGEGEVVTTCHILPPAGELQVVFADGATHAESTRLNRALDVCVLKVRTTGPTTAKVRGADPANDEKVYVVSIADPKAPMKLVETKVLNPVSSPAGMALKLETRETFASGAPVFDTQGRLVGIVTVPHQLGDFTLAFAASRIETARSQK